MSAEDLRGKPQAETETGLDLVQAYRQRLLIPVATIIATTQELGLFGKGWYRILEEKWGKNFSVNGSFVPTESFEFTAKTFRPMTQDFPLKNVHINTAMRRSQERHGVLNLGRTVEVNPEGKISLSLYRDPAKWITIDSPDKGQICVKALNHLPEGDKLPYEVDCQYWDNLGPQLKLSLSYSSGNLPAFEVHYANTDRHSPFLLQPQIFKLVGNLGGYFNIPGGLTREKLETFITGRTTEVIKEVQGRIPHLVAQFPLTFDSRSFVETTLGELEAELTALNADLKQHFPVQHPPFINIQI